MTTQPGIRWKAFSKNVDIDTGEQITLKEALTNYILIKTTKYVTTNEIKTTGLIEYTREYRRNPQQKIPFE